MIERPSVFQAPLEKQKPPTRPKQFEEPVPAKLYCGACHDSFLNYYTHIGSLQHRQNYYSNSYFQEIDRLILDLDKDRVQLESVMQTPESILTKTSI